MSDETLPVLRVVRGDPTDEELAALVAVVSAKVSAGDVADRRRRSSWASYWSPHRTVLTPGEGAWRASALPR